MADSVLATAADGEDLEKAAAMFSAVLQHGSATPPPSRSLVCVY